LAQQESLNDSKLQKNDLLKATKGQEAQYQKLLTAAQKQESSIFSELNNLENQALKNGSFLVHVTATSVPHSGTKLFGPPYASYKITQGYGYTHYAKSGAYGGNPHSGVDFVAGYGSAIHPIGEGTVLAKGSLTV